MKQDKKDKLKIKISKKELSKFKSLYKEGKLKFNPKEVAEEILTEHKAGMSRN